MRTSRPTSGRAADGEMASKPAFRVLRAVSPLARNHGNIVARQGLQIVDSISSQGTVMQKKSVVVLLTFVLFLGLAPLASAQLENPLSSPHRTLGYFNSDTGLFEPLRPGLQDPESPATTPTTGTLV